MSWKIYSVQTVICKEDSIIVRLLHYVLSNGKIVQAGKMCKRCIDCFQTAKNRVDTAVLEAADYLSSKVILLTDPLQLAMTAYALHVANHRARDDAYLGLKRMARSGGWKNLSVFGFLCCVFIRTWLVDVGGGFVFWAWFWFFARILYSQVWHPSDILWHGSTSPACVMKLSTVESLCNAQIVVNKVVST